MELKLDLDYELTKEDREGNPALGKESLPTPMHVTQALIHHVVAWNYNPSSANPQGRGIDGQLARTWHRLQKKLARAVREGIAIIEIERAEFDFLYDLREKPCHTNWNLWRGDFFFDYLEAVKLRLGEEKNP